MQTRLVPTPTSRLRLGLARVEITPPVGIYHRMWGAARHDRATGVHRPLTAEVLVFAPEGGGEPALVRAQIDLVGLGGEAYAAGAAAVARGAGVPGERSVLTFSHSHAAGFFSRDRASLRGGDLIAPYLAELEGRLEAAARAAAADLAPAVITYGTGRCGMNAHRDCWDEALPGHVCGFNPGGPADDTVTVARITGAVGELRGVCVHYACHPTTLAWENSLLSPDYVGALRETVERETGVPCVFLQGACGDLGPREGFVGDPAVADRNGRQVGYAALAALAALPAAGTDFAYAGPVVSGATLGTWKHVPHDTERAAAAARLAAAVETVPLRLRSLPTPERLREELAEWEARAAAATDPVAARDALARAERSRRWLARVADLPAGDTYAFPYTALRLGDAVWITCAAEPYQWLQAELRRRFPADTVLVSPLAGEMRVAYLLPEDRYGLGLYQEEPSLLAPGCLERLADAIAATVAALP